MQNLFVYGTLMFPQVCQKVVGRTFPGMQADLHGYERRTLTGEVYPGIVPARGKTVRGLLWTGVDEVSLTRIDRFEGSLYKREAVSVTREGGESGIAFVYVIRSSLAGRLSADTWDPLTFERQDLSRFLAGYDGFTYG